MQICGGAIFYYDTNVVHTHTHTRTQTHIHIHAHALHSRESFRRFKVKENATTLTWINMASSDDGGVANRWSDVEMETEVEVEVMCERRGVECVMSEAGAAQRSSSRPAHSNIEPARRRRPTDTRRRRLLTLHSQLPFSPSPLLPFFPSSLLPFQTHHWRHDDRSHLPPSVVF